MKQFFSFLVLFFGFFSFGFSQQWYTGHVPHGRDVMTSAILNDHTFVLGSGFEAAEEFEEYFYTLDCGLVGWAVASTDTPTSTVKSIAFKDSINGYGVCYHGKMVRTFDGGFSWTRVDTVSNKNFFKVIYVTPQTLYIAGGSQTKDSATIYKSYDGGDTWMPVYNQPGRWLKSIWFTDTLTGFAVGDSSQILKTTNGGMNWTTVASPVANRDLNGIFFLNAGTGYIIGGIRTDTVNSIRTILKTIDGGQNWTIVKDETGGRLNDITFSSQNEGYIVGDSGTVFKTTDGGQNWITQVIPNTSSDQRINTVSFYNSGLGIIGGWGGYLRFYTMSSLPEATTVSAVMTDTVTASLFASINTHGYQGAYSFIYSTDSAFSFYWGGLYPESVVTDSPVVFQSNTFPYPLKRDTTYYYFVQVKTFAGSVNSQMKSFFTHLPDYTFQTSQVSNITSNSATLNGLVDKLPSATNLYFEYGTTQSLGQTVAANPAVVSDTMQHNVSADVHALSPFVTYYFRLKGTGTGNSKYFGNTNTFMVGTVFSELQTLQATNLGTTTVTLNGTINKCNLPVTLSFEYDTNQNFSHAVQAVPALVNDTLQHSVSASLTNLLPLTQYYFRIKAHTSVGDYYGGTMSFALGLFSQFETIEASDIAATSAMLNGRIDGFQLPATLSFEYGVFGWFDHSVVASPDSVNDTLQHAVSATIDSLQPGQYNFRLKVHTAIGDFIGNTMSFYMSNFNNGNQKNGIKVYPNPSSTNLIVELNYPLNDECNIQLFDLYGKLRLQSNLPANTINVSLNVADLNPGFYMVRLKLGRTATLYSKKVVIK